MEDQGSHRLLPLVESYRRPEVEIGQRITADDQEGFRQQVGCIAHAAGGAEGRFLDRVGNRDTEVLPLAEIVLNQVSQILDRDHDLGNAVPPQQPENVL